MLLRLLLLVAMAAFASAKVPQDLTYYTLTGKLSEGCLNTCKCASRQYDITGHFELSVLTAGVLLQDIEIYVSGSSRKLNGVGVLHQNATMKEQVWFL